MSDGDAQLTGFDREYHERQFSVPYQSTVSFFNWLIERGVLGDNPLNICDLGCGKGANLHYLAKRFGGYRFTGLDIDEGLIRDGRELLTRDAVENCELLVGDLHDAASLFSRNQFDGVISLQTLSWLPDYRVALDAMAALAPKWIALTSLFFDGPVEAKTVIHEFSESDNSSLLRSLNYNTYSLPLFRRRLAELGFHKIEQRYFEIQIDLPRVSTGRMQTYTELTHDQRRLQVSGPLLMNWYFILAQVV
jgi:ubiquinone/menaquinone biosynthesis C-methylase UbiE